MKASVKSGAGASGDTTTAASVTWLVEPCRLLPEHGPVVLGVSPPLGAPMVRAWEQIAAQRGVGTPTKAGDRA